MKKIGIIGGIGPESTVDYYKLIIGAFHGKQPDLGYPEIIIYSANLSNLMRILEAREWDNLTDWLWEKVVALHKAGADFAVIGSNTPHIVFDKVRSRSPIPMLSIVEETRNNAQKRGFRKLGLLGTRFTMESDFFKKPFGESGMAVITPEKEDQELIHHRLFSEIELGIIKDSTRDELLSILKSTEFLICLVVQKPVDCVWLTSHSSTHALIRDSNISICSSSSPSGTYSI